MYAYVCVFAHSHFVENPPIRSWETNPSFLRWFCHRDTYAREERVQSLIQATLIGLNNHNFSIQQPLNMLFKKVKLHKDFRLMFQ
jgi:hypothetical protein